MTLVRLLNQSLFGSVPEEGLVVNTAPIYRAVDQQESDFVIDYFVISEMSRTLCPVNKMEW